MSITGRYQNSPNAGENGAGGRWPHSAERISVRTEIEGVTAKPGLDCKNPLNREAKLEHVTLEHESWKSRRSRGSTSDSSLRTEGANGPVHTGTKPSTISEQPVQS